MRIRFKPRILRLNLILGLIWLIFGVLWLWQGTLLVLVAGYLMLALLYLTVFGFMYLKPYLIIEKGMLTKNGLQPKRIRLADIDQIKKVDGEMILKTKDDTLKINTYYLDNESRQELLRILELK